MKAVSGCNDREIGALKRDETSRKNGRQLSLDYQKVDGLCPKHVSFDLLGSYSINMEFLVLRHNLVPRVSAEGFCARAPLDFFEDSTIDALPILV